MREQAFYQLNDLIERAKAEGQIRQDLPTSIITRAMVCLQATLAHHLPDPPDEANIDENIDHVISILIQGIQS